MYVVYWRYVIYYTKFDNTQLDGLSQIYTSSNRFTRHQPSSNRFKHQYINSCTYQFLSNTGSKWAVKKMEVIQGKKS